MSLLNPNTNLRIIEDGISRNQFYISKVKKRDYVPIGNCFISRKRRGEDKVSVSNEMLNSWLHLEYLIFHKVNIEKYIRQVKEFNIPVYITDTIPYGILNTREVEELPLLLLEEFKPKSFIKFLEYHEEKFGLEFIHMLNVEYQYLEREILSYLNCSYDFNVFLACMTPSIRDVILYLEFSRLTNM